MMTGKGGGFTSTWPQPQSSGIAAAATPAELYRGARLAAALDWSAAHAVQMNLIETDFLARSGEESQREMLAQRRPTGGSVGCSPGLWHCWCSRPPPL